MNRIILLNTLWIVTLGGAVVWGVNTAAAQTEPTTGALTNKMCPVLTDEPVDPEIAIAYQGQQVYFCCQKCRRRFERNPAEYAEGLAQVMPATPVAAQDSSGGHDDDHENTAGAGDDHDNAGAETIGEATDPDHDHTIGHGPKPGQQSALSRAIAFAGKFHPLVIHFPIALLTAAALAELLLMVTGLSWLTGAARFSVILGAVGAAGATLLGWANAAFANYGPDMVSTLSTHRWLGTTVALLSILVVSLSEANVRRPSSKLRLWYRGMLFAVTLLVGITGHFGATLVYGLNYFTW